jgi:hypothetical protein
MLVTMPVGTPIVVIGVRNRNTADEHRRRDRGSRQQMFTKMKHELAPLFPIKTGLFPIKAGDLLAAG